MPRSQRPRSQGRNGQELRNQIRGQSATMASIALARLRATGAPVDLADLAPWAVTTYPFGPFATGLRPKRYRLLMRSKWLDPLDLKSEIIWCISLLRHFSADLSIYIAARNGAFNAVMRNDLDSALAQLHDLDETVGLSIVTMEQRIGYLQMFRGIDAAKDYIARISREADGAQSAFLAYWFGVRIEDRSTASGFRRNILNSLQRWNVGDNYKMLIRFLLLGEKPDADQEPELLCSANSMSIIDLYECFIRLAVGAVVQDSASGEAFRLAAAGLALSIDEPRLRMIAAGTNEAAASKFVWQNERFALPGLMDHFENPPVDTPLPADETITFESLLSLVATGKTLPELQGPFWARLSNSLIATAGDTPPSRAANSDLGKLGMAFNLTDFGQWAAAAKLSEDREQPFVSNEAALGRLIYNGAVSYAILPSLPPALRRELAETAPDRGLATYLCGLKCDGATIALTPTADIETRIRSARREADYEAVVSLASEARRKGLTLTRTVLISEAEALIMVGQRKDAIELCARQMLLNVAYAAWVPFDTIVADLTSHDWNSLSNTIYTPIFLYFFQSERLGTLSSQLSYATEDFLFSLGVTYPSEMLDHAEAIDRNALIFFLDRVCTAQTLRLSTDYETDEDIAKQRLEICKHLAQINADDAAKYEQEAREIVREGLVRDALQELQGSKISIDEEPLLLWAERNLKDDFQRYQAMLRSGTAVIDGKFRESLYAAVRAGITTLTLEVPKNEASSLFYSIVSRFIHECALNPEHGIDCYLSVRIRHGTVSGLLRGASEREKIVTRKSAGFYRVNEFWRTALQDQLEPERLAAISDRFRQFSQFIDAEASELTDDLIQVGRPDKPRGMFGLNLAEQSIYAMATEVRADTTFEDLMSSCLEIFWQLVEQSLVKLRAHLRGKLLTDMRAEFDALEEDFVLMLDPDYTGSLLDGVRRARSETISAISGMVGWFELPTPSRSLPFEIPVIAQVALTTFKNFHPMFDPDLTIDADGVGPISGILRSHSDIFFTLFENISNHGGHVGQPRVSIRSYIVGGRVITTVRNELGENADNICAEALDDLKKRICAGEYRDRIRSEGGTGLPKVAKLCNLQPADPDFDFAIDRNANEFYVTFATEFVVNKPEQSA